MSRKSVAQEHGKLGAQMICPVLPGGLRGSRNNCICLAKASETRSAGTVSGKSGAFSFPNWIVSALARFSAATSRRAEMESAASAVTGAACTEFYAGGSRAGTAGSASKNTLFGSHRIMENQLGFEDNILRSKIDFAQTAIAEECCNSRFIFFGMCTAILKRENAGSCRLSPACG